MSLLSFLQPVIEQPAVLDCGAVSSAVARSTVEPPDDFLVDGSLAVLSDTAASTTDAVTPETSNLGPSLLDSDDALLASCLPGYLNSFSTLVRHHIDVIPFLFYPFFSFCLVFFGFFTNWASPFLRLSMFFSENIVFSSLRFFQCNSLCIFSIVFVLPFFFSSFLCFFSEFYISFFHLLEAVQFLVWCILYFPQFDISFSFSRSCSILAWCHLTSFHPFFIYLILNEYFL